MRSEIQENDCGTLHPSEELPEEFQRKMRLLLGEEYHAFIKSYEQEAARSLRLNPLKFQRGFQLGSDNAKEEISSVLGEIFAEPTASAKTVPWEPLGYYYQDCSHPGRHPYHEAGLYYIQEPSAMSVAALAAAALHYAADSVWNGSHTALPDFSGIRALDLCAAPGGKSARLAAEMNQQGLFVANEIHPVRAKILSRNIERLGISNALVTNETPERLAQRFPGFFHMILVDAPCSGEGMFRKDPSSRGEWSPAQVEICRKRQEEILVHARRMLSPGGILVYSTCTFSPEENEMVLSDFLSSNPGFQIMSPDQLIHLPGASACGQISAFSHGRPEWADHSPEVSGAVRLWPHLTRGEGHFAAVLWDQAGYEKNDRMQTERAGKKAVANASFPWAGDRSLLAAKKLWNDFVSCFLNEGIRHSIREERLFLFGDQLYCLPQCCPSFKGFKVLRPGLHLGSIKKERFQPSHALALFLKPEDVKSSLSWGAGSDEIRQYLNGETLVLHEEGDGAERNGWQLVCADRYSIGWGKAVNGILKNHYPKGLRRTVWED